MDWDVVHYQLTREWAQEIFHSWLGKSAGYLAELVARGDNDVDEACSLVSFFRPYHRLIHFADWDEVLYCWQHALLLGHPYVAGVVLHQAQDYFSHWGEGYRLGSFGHSYHLLRWRLRNQRVKEHFYSLYPRERLEGWLRELYPEVSFNRFDDWELVDLYLRERSLSRWEERGIYGYNPDLYYAHTRRDQEMKRVTCALLHEYLDRLLANPELLENVQNRCYSASLSLLVRFCTLMLIRGNGRGVLAR